jgi:hypothetical protein
VWIVEPGAGQARVRSASGPVELRWTADALAMVTERRSEVHRPPWCLCAARATLDDFGETRRWNRGSI